MEPMREVATTVYSPFWRAAMDRIISTTLPNVAFSSPPMVSPNLSGRARVGECGGGWVGGETAVRRGGWRLGEWRDCRLTPTISTYCMLCPPDSQILGDLTQDQRQRDEGEEVLQAGVGRGWVEVTRAGCGVGLEHLSWRGWSRACERYGVAWGGGIQAGQGNPGQ